MALPKIGNKAPAFNLKNQKDESVKLSDQAGRWIVFYFYPKALTPGCTTQACGLRDVQAELSARNAIAFGVSPDPVARLQKFIDKYDLNFDLLSDEDHAIAEKYGVWDLKKFMGKEYMGIVRTTFIINPEGRLAYIFDKVKTKTHHDDVLAKLDELKSE